MWFQFSVEFSDVIHIVKVTILSFELLKRRKLARFQEIQQRPQFLKNTKQCEYSDKEICLFVCLFVSESDTLREFWRGVPVMRRRLAVTNSLSASWSAEALFLRRWASSTTRKFHSMVLKISSSKSKHTKSTTWFTNKFKNVPIIQLKRNERTNFKDFLKRNIREMNDECWIMKRTVFEKNFVSSD